jgi:ribosomal protein L40E
MMLSDWISAVLSLVAIILLFLKAEIPYGTIMDHLGELGPDGKPVPNRWMVRQARRDRLRRLLLWAITIGGLCVISMRRLEWLATLLIAVIAAVIVFFLEPVLEGPRNIFLRKMGLARTKKEGGMKKPPLRIKDSEFRTQVEDAKDAVGMEVNTPAQLDGVKSELMARNVDRAVGFTTNQPMTITAGTCRRCNGPLNSVTLGERPTVIICEKCGEENPIS